MSAARSAVVVVDYVDPYGARTRLPSRVLSAPPLPLAAPPFPNKSSSSRRGISLPHLGGRTKDDDLTARRAVAELGASGFAIGVQKARSTSALAAIGAVIKPQRMPFKMMIGVDRKRAARAEKAETEARLSGVVRAGGAGGNKRKKLAAKKAGREREAEDEPTPYDQRGSVLHAGKR